MSYAKIAGVVAAVALVAAALFWFVKQRSCTRCGHGQPEDCCRSPVAEPGLRQGRGFSAPRTGRRNCHLAQLRALATIRPFATTSKYDSPTLDLQEAGKAMHVTNVVTGHYMKQGDQIQITLEAVDVADNRTLWRDTMTVAAPDMIAMRNQITSKVRQGLVPALGVGDGFRGSRHPPQE